MTTQVRQLCGAVWSTVSPPQQQHPDILYSCTASVTSIFKAPKFQKWFVFPQTPKNFLGIIWVLEMAGQQHAAFTRHSFLLKGYNTHEQIKNYSTYWSNKCKMTFSQYEAHFTKIFITQIDRYALQKRQHIFHVLRVAEGWKQSPAADSTAHLLQQDRKSRCCESCILNHSRNLFSLWLTPSRYSTLQENASPLFWIYLL